jgi:DnaJ-class molecular chaperone
MKLHLGSRNEVMSHFRQLAFQHHPDYGGDPAKFRELIAARDRALKKLSTYRQAAAQGSRRGSLQSPHGDPAS